MFILSLIVRLRLLFMVLMAVKGLCSHWNQRANMIFSLRQQLRGLTQKDRKNWFFSW
jgi:hypothetical protein